MSESGMARPPPDVLGSSQVGFTAHGSQPEGPGSRRLKGCSRMGRGLTLIHRQTEFSPDRFVIVRKRQFVAAVHNMALSARPEAQLHGASRREIFGGYHLDSEGEVRIPVPLLVRGLGRLRDVEGCL